MYLHLFVTTFLALETVCYASKMDKLALNGTRSYHAYDLLGSDGTVTHGKDIIMGLNDNLFKSEDENHSVRKRGVSRWLKDKTKKTGRRRGRRSRNTKNNESRRENKERNRSMGKETMTRSGAGRPYSTLMMYKPMVEAIKAVHRCLMSVFE